LCKHFTITRHQSASTKASRDCTDLIYTSTHRALASSSDSDQFHNQMQFTLSMSRRDRARRNVNLISLAEEPSVDCLGGDGARSVHRVARRHECDLLEFFVQIALAASQDETAPMFTFSPSSRVFPRKALTARRADH
jgi:hypothetical protein